jgi:tetratricopeptide (TPR) repeat protein
MVPVTAADVSRRKLRVVIVCCIAGLAAAGGGFEMYKRTMDPVRAHQSFDSGMRLFKSGRYQEATLWFDRAVHLKSDFADPYFMRGRCFITEGKPRLAIADFTNFLDLRPGDTQGLIDRATAYLNIKDNSSAVADANTLLHLNPNQAIAYTLRGTALRAMGDAQNAIENFNKAIELSPSPENYYERGATYQSLGDHSRAIADFDQVIAYHPDAAAGYFARAESRRAIGDVEGAKQDSERGRVIDGR